MLRFRNLGFIVDYGNYGKFVNLALTLGEMSVAAVEP